MPTDDMRLTQKQGDSCLLLREDADDHLWLLFPDYYRGLHLEQDMERHREAEGSAPSQKAGGKGEQASDVE